MRNKRLEVTGNEELKKIYIKMKWEKVNVGRITILDGVLDCRM